MMDMLSLMNFIIIFTLFLAVGVLVIIFYQVIKIDFNKLKEIPKTTPSRKETLEEKSESARDDLKVSMKATPMEVLSTNSQAISTGNEQTTEKQSAPELNKVDDVEALLKGTSKTQDEKGLTLANDLMEIKSISSSDKVAQPKQSIESVEKVLGKEEPEQLNEVESLLKVEEVRPSDVRRQFTELSEYVKKLRDTLKAFKKDEEA